MDSFLRRVMQQRDEETELRSKLEVVVGQKLCEVCHDVLRPGHPRGQGRFDTEKRCADCHDILMWLPSPSPLDAIPADFRPRSNNPRCQGCGDEMQNSRESGKASFCPKLECRRARTSHRARLNRAEIARERALAEPKPTLHIVKPEAPPLPRNRRPNGVPAAEQIFQEWRSKQGIAPPWRNPPKRHTRTSAAKEHDAVVDRLIAERKEADAAARRRRADEIIKSARKYAAEGRQEEFGQEAVNLPFPPEMPPAAKEASSAVPLTGEPAMSMPESEARTCPLDNKPLPENNTNGFCTSHWYKHTGKFNVRDYIETLRKSIEIPAGMQPRLSAKQRSHLVKEGIDVPPEVENGKAAPSNKDKQRATRKVKHKRRAKHVRKAASPGKQPMKEATGIEDDGDLADLGKRLTIRAGKYETEAKRLDEVSRESFATSKKFKEEAIKLRAAAKLLGQVK